MIVSIIIPAYNTALYIGRCLDSVCMQTYKDIEIIVIDDASTDNTLSIINQYAKRDKRIKIIHHSENRGNGIGRNTAIKKSHGEYVLFVDSDDEIVPHCVETLVTATISGKIDFAIYGYQNVILSKKRKISAKQGKTVLPNLVGEENHKELVRNFLIFGKNVKMSPWMYFCKKDFIIQNDIWFDESGRNFEDVIYTTKLFYYARKIEVVHKALYHYSNRQHSIMNSHSKKKIEDRIYAFNSVRDFLKLNGEFESNKIAYTYFFIHSVFFMSFFDMLKMKTVEKDLYDFMRSFAESTLVTNFHKVDISILNTDKTDAKDWNTIKKVRNCIYFISHHFRLSYKCYRFVYKIGHAFSLRVA